MLKIEPLRKETDLPKHLIGKGRQIVITNVCNLHCGGCCQLIGHFAKEQLWFIKLDDLEDQIRLLERHPVACGGPTAITIFGGEPTLHPQWDEIVRLLKRHAPTVFWINTNGRLGHRRYEKEDNLVWWVDLHPDKQLFVQTLYAAADALKLPTDMDYWKKAQKDCDIWKGCATSIYNGKAYFCENAAAIDWLFNDGKNGWALEADKHPFERSKEEIDEQARHCCKRCGWCVTELVPRQLSKDPSYISPMNQEGSNGRFALPVLTPMRPQRWEDAEDPSLPPAPSIGIYRLRGHFPTTQPVLDNESTWYGVVKHEATSRAEALADGRSKYDWTIILEPRYVFPRRAFVTLTNWVRREQTKTNPRRHLSIPVFDLPAADYDHEMEEPSILAKNVVVGFHRESKESYDEEIYGKLGHRKTAEGSGRPSLWHDRLTDIVGGIINLN